LRSRSAQTQLAKRWREAASDTLQAVLRSRSAQTQLARFKLEKDHHEYVAVTQLAAFWRGRRVRKAIEEIVTAQSAVRDEHLRNRSRDELLESIATGTLEMFFCTIAQRREDDEYVAATRIQAVARGQSDRRLVQGMQLSLVSLCDAVRGELVEAVQTGLWEMFYAELEERREMSAIMAATAATEEEERQLMQEEDLASKTLRQLPVAPRCSQLSAPRREMQLTAKTDTPADDDDTAMRLAFQAMEAEKWRRVGEAMSRGSQVLLFGQKYDFAVRIQKTFRGYRGRKVVLQARAAQKAVLHEMMMTRLGLKDAQPTQLAAFEASTVKLQAAWRGKNTRNLTGDIFRKTPLKVKTELASAHGAGTMKLEVASHSGFATGDVVVIGQGRGSELHIIVGFGSILLQRPTQKDHPAGTTVGKVGSQAELGVFRSQEDSYVRQQQQADIFARARFALERATKFAYYRETYAAEQDVVGIIQASWRARRQRERMIEDRAAAQLQAGERGRQARKMHRDRQVEAQISYLNAEDAKLRDDARDELVEAAQTGSLFMYLDGIIDKRKGAVIKLQSFARGNTGRRQAYWQVLAEDRLRSAARTELIESMNIGAWDMFLVEVQERREMTAAILEGEAAPTATAEIQQMAREDAASEAFRAALRPRSSSEVAAEMKTTLSSRMGNMLGDSWKRGAVMNAEEQERFYGSAYCCAIKLQRAWRRYDVAKFVWQALAARKEEARLMQLEEITAFDSMDPQRLKTLEKAAIKVQSMARGRLARTSALQSRINKARGLQTSRPSATRQSKAQLEVRRTHLEIQRREAKRFDLEQADCFTRARLILERAARSALYQDPDRLQHQAASKFQALWRAWKIRQSVERMRANGLALQRQQIMAADVAMLQREERVRSECESAVKLQAAARGRQGRVAAKDISLQEFEARTENDLREWVRDEFVEAANTGALFMYLQSLVDKREVAAVMIQRRVRGLYGQRMAAARRFSEDRLRSAARSELIESMQTGAWEMFLVELEERRELAAREQEARLEDRELRTMGEEDRAGKALRLAFPVKEKTPQEEAESMRRALHNRLNAMQGESWTRTKLQILDPVEQRRIFGGLYDSTVMIQRHWRGNRVRQMLRLLLAASQAHLRSHTAQKQASFQLEMEELWRGRHEVRAQIKQKQVIATRLQALERQRQAAIEKKRRQAAAQIQSPSACR